MSKVQILAEPPPDPPIPSPEDRRRLAELVGVHPATLYQALTGKGAGFSPAECVRIERESARDPCPLRRWQLRRFDWWEIWPELISIEGAPPVPAQRDTAEVQKAA